MADWLKQRTKTAKKRADVIVLYSPEGAGKTSFATNFKDAAVAMSESETGLLTLVSKKLVEPTSFFPEFTSWDDIVEATDEMIASADRPRSFVLDTMSGAQNLLVDDICDKKYGGEMDRRGFLNFSEGWDAMVPIWRAWLAKLDRLRNKGTTIVLLAHAQVANHKNPSGTDYHRFVAELHPKMWSAVRKFADLVCFLNFNTTTVGGDMERGTAGTGQGGATRVYHFERTAAFDAKNRHNLPAKMMGTGNHATDFAEFCRLIKEGEVGPAAKKSKAKTTKPAAEKKTETADAADAADDATAS